MKRRLSSNGNSNFTNYANTNITINNNTKNIHVEVSTANREETAKTLPPTMTTSKQEDAAIKMPTLESAVCTP